MRPSRDPQTPGEPDLKGPTVYPPSPPFPSRRSFKSRRAADTRPDICPHASSSVRAPVTVSACRATRRSDARGSEHEPRARRLRHDRARSSEGNYFELGLGSLGVAEGEPLSLSPALPNALPVAWTALCAASSVFSAAVFRPSLVLSAALSTCLPARSIGPWASWFLWQPTKREPASTTMVRVFTPKK